MKSCNIVISKGCCKKCNEEYIEASKYDPDCYVGPTEVDYMEMGPDPLDDGAVRWYSCGHIYYSRTGIGELRYLGQSS